MQTIDNQNFENHKVLMRVDFNVPLNTDLEVTDNTRLKGALPSIKKILTDGGSVVLMSHLGRPKKGREEKFSLKNVVAELEQLLDKTVQFVEDCVGEKAQAAVANVAAGEVLLLENLRFYPEETQGDEAFAQQLADLGCDTYVNDAFGTAHRAHASTFTVAQFFPSDRRFAGFLLGKEIANASNLSENPQRPFTAILGGAKVSDKIMLIESLLDKTDNIIIGGGMAYTFWRAKGGKTGNSLVETDKIELAQELLDKAAVKGVQLLLPEDSIIADAFDNDANTKTAQNSEIPDGWMGLDIGSAARQTFTDTILASKTIFWNGPMGVFEMSSFQAGTKTIAEAVVAATAKGAYSLIGGGDSVAAIQKFDFADDVSYVSTGGGAMLEFLEGKELPGVQALS